MHQLDRQMQDKLQTMFGDGRRTQYAREDLEAVSAAANPVDAEEQLPLDRMAILLPELRVKRKGMKKQDLIPDAKPLLVWEARPVKGLTEGVDYRLDYYKGGDAEAPLRVDDYVKEITDAGEYRLCAIALSSKLRGSQVVPFKVGRRTPWALLLALLLALLAATAVLLGLYLNNEGPWYDPNAGEGLAGLSDEDKMALLEAKVKESMMNITILSPIPFPDGTLNPGHAGFNNIAQNHYDQKLTITLEDTGEVVYESGAIAPGQNLEYITLNRALDSGVYQAIATVTGYDRETHKQAAELAARVQLEVG